MSLVVLSSSSDIQSSQSIPGSQSTPRFSVGSQANSLSQASHGHTGPLFEIPALKPPKLIIDQVHINHVHHRLCEGTSGYSVEQLEQVNAAMMDAIWNSRTLWNRNDVASKALEAFEDIDENIREMQKVMDASGSF